MGVNVNLTSHTVASAAHIYRPHTVAAAEFQTSGKISKYKPQLINTVYYAESSLKTILLQTIYEKRQLLYFILVLNDFYSQSQNENTLKKHSDML